MTGNIAFINSGKWEVSIYLSPSQITKLQQATNINNMKQY